MLDKLRGKKYQSRLTENVRESRPGVSRGSSNTSSTRPSTSTLSIEPIDLKGSFFARDDLSPIRDENVRNGKRKTSLGIHTGYILPEDQDTPGRHSLESQRSPPMNASAGEGSSIDSRSPKHSSGASTSHRGSTGSSSSKNRKSVAFHEPVSPEGEHEMSTMDVAQRQPLNKSDSFFFDNDYDMSDMSRTNNFPATEPRGEEHANLRSYSDSDDEEGHVIEPGHADAAAVGFDPMVDYHSRPSSDVAQTYYADAQLKDHPAFREKSGLDDVSEDQEEHEKHNALEDHHVLLAGEKTSAFNTTVIPSMNTPEDTNHQFSPTYRHNVLADQIAAMTYAPKTSVGSIQTRTSSKREKAYEDDDSYTGLALHRKGLRSAKRWYGSWSTRKTILAIVAAILLVLLILGVTLGVVLSRRANSASPGLTPTWRPSMGTTWNIQLAAPITQRPNSAAFVYDIDLFDNNATTVAMLHEMGRRVVCYFSAGTYEDWRPDASSFPNATIGTALPEWKGENWIDIRSKDVRAIMEKRIDRAAAMGCDGIDPDNVNVYSAPNSGFNITQQDGADYVNALALYSHTSLMAIGLKNAPEIINATLANLDWELTESCVQYNECHLYQPFIVAGKPVLHIEYTEKMNATLLMQSCSAPGTSGYSSLLKRSKLDQWSVSCPIGQTGDEYGNDSTH